MKIYLYTPHIVGSDVMSRELMLWLIISAWFRVAAVLTSLMLSVVCSIKRTWTCLYLHATYSFNCKILHCGQGHQLLYGQFCKKTVLFESISKSNFLDIWVWRIQSATLSIFCLIWSKLYNRKKFTSLWKLMKKDIDSTARPEASR